MDRRGWGPLRIRVDRSAARRAHPVHRRIAKRYRATLRARWRDLLRPLAMLVVLCACLALPSHGRPLFLGFYVGLCAGILLAVVAGTLFVLDGSLFKRIGLGVAGDLGDDLRRVRGVYGVLSEVMFDRLDIDHVVLAPAGVFVLEVKWSLSPTADLDHHQGLAADLAQARAGARKVTGLLRSTAPGVPVHTVLVLCGPGAPDLDGPAHRDGITVVNAMTRPAWAAFLAQHGPAVWGVEGARPAAEALTGLRDRRITYELTHQQPTGQQIAGRSAVLTGGVRTRFTCQGCPAVRAGDSLHR